jgi:hypothetical protein
VSYAVATNSSSSPTPAGIVGKCYAWTTWLTTRPNGHQTPARCGRAHPAASQSANTAAWPI